MITWDFLDVVEYTSTTYRQKPQFSHGWAFVRGLRPSSRTLPESDSRIPERQRRDTCHIRALSRPPVLFISGCPRNLFHFHVAGPTPAFPATARHACSHPPPLSATSTRSTCPNHVDAPTNQSSSSLPPCRPALSGLQQMNQAKTKEQ